MSIFTNSFSAASDEAGDYTTAVLELVGERDPIEVLRELVGAVETAVHGIDAETLTRPEAPGKWSMLALIQHLADSEVVWCWRLRQIVASERPEITGYDQDRWATRLHYDEVPLELALDQLRVMRRVNLWFIESLSEDELQRVGFHNERGDESVQHMVRLYAGHDLVHRRQLERIRAGLKPVKS